MIDPFWWPILAGGVLSGMSSGLLGIYVVALRIPFLAVCVAHAALAGAVFALLAGVQGSLVVGGFEVPWMLLPALAAAALTALALGGLEGRGVHFDSNILIGVLFSLSLGLAFLGISLYSASGRPDQDVVRGLLWGSLLLCRWQDVRLMLLVGGVLGVFIVLFRKEMRALMFSREVATAAGIPVGPIWTVFLVLTSAVLTVNFQTVGGLMIYSLVTNPAVAAMQVARGHDRILLLAITFGAVVSIGGFAIAAVLDWPVGATIVIFSSLLVVLAGGWRRVVAGQASPSASGHADLRPGRGAGL
ncbi:MAG: metal ABC transporter permease [Phycisphaerales bacterium]|nr:metal ABC transporter permease [Phycisphaerales bacterium]